MKVSEVGEIVAEHAHSGRPQEGASGCAACEGFRRRTAMLVGVMGMLLAIASLGGE